MGVPATRSSTCHGDKRSRPKPGWIDNSSDGGSFRPDENRAFWVVCFQESKVASLAVPRRIVIMRRILVFILLVMVPSVRAQVPPPPAEQLPSQAKVVKGALVPVPEEIFHLLDKFSGAYWHLVQRPEIVRWKPHGDQVHIALLLGVVVAEGFIAMEGKDSAEVKDVGHAVLSLARGLGVGRVALRRNRSIMEYAEQNKWTAARKEWDGVLSDLEKGMIELRSERISQLVSLGGWVRGMEALCALVIQDYSPERAELIRQTAVIDYLEKQLVEMQRDVRQPFRGCKNAEGDTQDSQTYPKREGPDY